MRIEQAIWTNAKGWQCDTEFSLGRKAQLVLVFGSFDMLKNRAYYDYVHSIYSKAKIMGCSTAGEILGTRVYDDIIALTAISFDTTHIEYFSTQIEGTDGSYKAGADLAGKLPKEGLSHVFVLSEGLKINGSVLTAGLSSKLSPEIAVTGGLAGDQGKFIETLVLSEDGLVKNVVSAIGFYGKDLKVGYGYQGGWTPFGLDRCITRSKGNIIYELDGQSALSLYKKYLGEQAKNLPSSGLLFPLRLCEEESNPSLVRTILGVNEKDGSMVFAGNMPQGGMVRLMKANIDRLVGGAGEAAERAFEQAGKTTPELAILISCVGRKLVLKQRVEEEVEIVQETLGQNTFMTGFYSYGEICPCLPGQDICELHNQTMTITTLSEEG